MPSNASRTAALGRSFRSSPRRRASGRPTSCAPTRSPRPRAVLETLGLVVSRCTVVFAVRARPAGHCLRLRFRASLRCLGTVPDHPSHRLPAIWQGRAFQQRRTSRMRLPPRPTCWSRCWSASARRCATWRAWTPLAPWWFHRAESWRPRRRRPGVPPGGEGCSPPVRRTCRILLGMTPARLLGIDGLRLLLGPCDRPTGRPGHQAVCAGL
jgi:hypothetical protein